MLAIDISTSMLAQDLQPDRIQAAKQVAGNFITDRPGDRASDWWPSRAKPSPKAR